MTDEIISQVIGGGIFAAVVGAGLFFYVEKTVRLIEWIVNKIKRWRK